MDAAVLASWSRTQTFLRQTWQLAGKKKDA
jgi:hypothetical protein